MHCIRSSVLYLPLHLNRDSVKLPLAAPHSFEQLHIYSISNSPCTHVQVASATLVYITKTVATHLATNTIIIFFLLNGYLPLCSHRLRHMRARCIGLIPSMLANTKVSKVAQNTHMAMQLQCRARPNIADNPPLPQPCKEVHHPCTIEAMNIVKLLLVFTQNYSTNIR